MGRDTEANEVIVGTSTGVHQVRSVRRLAGEERYNKKLMEEMVFPPWMAKLDNPARVLFEKEVPPAPEKKPEKESGKHTEKEPDKPPVSSQRCN